MNKFNLYVNLYYTNRKWSLNPSGWQQFEIRQGNQEAYGVDLEKRECTCRQWQLTGIPCPHAITGIYFINKQPEEYVSNSFKVSTYKNIYKLNILPVGGSDVWKKRKHVPMKPPLEIRMPGRPTLNRRKDKSELKNNTHVARPPRTMTCQNCGGMGHNKKGCTKPKETVEPSIQTPNPEGQPATQTPTPNPPKKKGRPMVNDPVNSRTPSCSRKKKVVTARGGIWMGSTSAGGSSGRGSSSGSNSGRGRGSGIASNRGRGRGSANMGRGRGRGRGSANMLFDDDDLVDVQLQQEDDTRANTSSVNNEPANVDDALVDVEIGQAKTDDMNVDAVE